MIFNIPLYRLCLGIVSCRWIDNECISLIVNKRHFFNFKGIHNISHAISTLHIQSTVYIIHTLYE